MGLRVPKALFLHFSPICQSCCPGKGPFLLAGAQTWAPAPRSCRPRASLSHRIPAGGGSRTKGAAGSGNEGPVYIPVSRTLLCPLTPGNHSGNSGLGFSSGFPRGAQSSSAGDVPWALVSPSTFVSSSSVLGTSQGAAASGPAQPSSAPIPCSRRGGSWHRALPAALGTPGCPARPAPPFPAPCLHQEKFVTFT